MSGRCAKYREPKNKDLGLKTDFTKVFKKSIRLNRKGILFSFELGASGLLALQMGRKTESFLTNWEKVIWPDFTGFPSKYIRLLGKKASIIFSETGLNLTQKKRTYWYDYNNVDSNLSNKWRGWSKHRECR